MRNFPLHQKNWGIRDAKKSESKNGRNYAVDSISYSVGSIGQVDAGDSLVCRIGKVELVLVDHEALGCVEVFADDGSALSSVALPAENLAGN